MRNKRFVQTALIGAICLGITTWVGAWAFKGFSPMESYAQPQSQQLPDQGVDGQAARPDRWRVVDDFRKGLPVLLSNSDNEPGSFNIEGLARQLYAVRVGGLPVCSPDEVSAQQYIYLSEIAHKLERFENATAQLNTLLDTSAGISDCQFRVLDGATATPGISKK